MYQIRRRIWPDSFPAEYETLQTLQTLPEVLEWLDEPQHNPHHNPAFLRAVLIIDPSGQEWSRLDFLYVHTPSARVS
jgi:hypothetical protein